MAQSPELNTSTKETWMALALSLAETASRMGEVPVGAVIVQNGRLVATGLNQRESQQDPTLHAEIVAIRRASAQLKSWRLSDCDLYVTLEPCLMCAGAIYQARMRNVFIGAMDPKAGATGSLYCVHSDARLNHNFNVYPNILADSSSSLLKKFFQSRRNK